MLRKQADQGYVSREERKVPSINLGDVEVHLNRVDPYGLIQLSLSNGELPPKYQGLYTTPEMAKTDINKYAQERQEAIKDIRNEEKKEWPKGKKASAYKISLLEDTLPKPQD